MGSSTIIRDEVRRTGRDIDLPSNSANATREERRGEERRGEGGCEHVFLTCALFISAGILHDPFFTACYKHLESNSQYRAAANSYFHC